MEFDKKLAEKSFEKSLDEREFYTVGYLKSLGIMVFTLLGMIMSFGYMAYGQFIYTPPISYIALNHQSQMLEDIPLNKMNLEKKEIQQWTTDALIDITSWNYLNFDKHGVKANKYFFEKEAPKFMNQFNNLNLQKIIRSNKAIVIPKIIDIFEVKKSMEWKGRAAAILEGVILLKIYGTDGMKVKRYEVKIAVAREKLSQKQDGISIIKIDLGDEKAQ